MTWTDTSTANSVSASSILQTQNSYGSFNDSGFRWPTVSQTVNFGVGLGNAVSFGAGGAISEWVNGDGAFDRDSDAFRYGGYSAFFAGGTGVLKGALTTANGFLLKGITIRSPFNIPVQRFGNMSIRGGQHWGPKIGTSSFLNRSFAAIKKEWNPLTQYTAGIIPKGTPVTFGIVGSQGFRYPGGSLQFMVESRQVIEQTTRIIPR